MAVTIRRAGRREGAVAFPKLEMIRSFGVGYDQSIAVTRASTNIVVTNTTDVVDRGGCRRRDGDF